MARMYIKRSLEAAFISVSGNMMIPTMDFQKLPKGLKDTGTYLGARVFKSQ